MSLNSTPVQELRARVNVRQKFLRKRYVPRPLIKSDKGKYAPRHTSLLLKLPGEIRNMVYDLLLVSSYSSDSTNKPTIYNDRHIWEGKGVFINILCTCTQTYTEALQILYSKNLFAMSFSQECYPGPMYFCPYVPFSQVYNPTFSIIKRLRIELDVQCVHKAETESVDRVFCAPYVYWDFLADMKGLEELQIIFQRTYWQYHENAMDLVRAVLRLSKNSAVNVVWGVEEEDKKRPRHRMHRDYVDSQRYEDIVARTQMALDMEELKKES